MGGWVDLDMTRYLSLLLFIGLAWGQRINNNLFFDQRDSEDIIGQWIYEDHMINMHILSGTDQIIPDYNQYIGRVPAQGIIELSGTINGQMNHMNLGMLTWYSYYYGITSLLISNHPISLITELENLELPIYEFRYSVSEDTVECSLNVIDTSEGDTILSNWVSYNTNDYVIIDTSSYTVNINDLFLVNTDTSDSVLISGELLINLIDVVAGEPLVIPYPWEFFQEFEDISWEFFNDGTGIRAYQYWDDFYNYWWVDSTDVVWSATNDSIFIDSGNSNLFSFSYDLFNDTLNLSDTYNSCEIAHYGCSQYLNMLSDMMGIENLQQILNEEIRTYTNAIPLSSDGISISPLDIKLKQNYPNPFNPNTIISFDLPEDAMVNLTIYDMMGRVVKTMVNTQQNAGFKSVRWNATNDKGSPVSAGLYLYTIQAGEYRQTKKMVLLK